MKHLVASLIIGACLLLPSAGVVFAMDPHNGTGGLTAQKGQPGTGGAGASCGAAGATPPPGQALTSNSINSPFPTTNNPFPNKAYAGSGLVGPDRMGQPNSSAHANSQYDVACFQPH